MRLAELAFLYACVGIGCASLLLARRGMGQGLDAALLVPLWPLLAPSLLMNEAPRVARTGLLVTDEATARAIERGMRAASARIAEIDRVLGKPGFSLEEAMAHQRELAERGRPELAEMALRRVRDIRRLRTLRERFAAEMEQVSELLEQLAVQAEVVRLSGAPDAGVREIVAELMAHVEGLDEALSIEAGAAIGPE